MSNMRAKMQVGFVQVQRNENGETAYETLTMHAVAKSSYGEDGSDEDNNYARWSPGAHLQINIANPALFGQFEVGQKYYVDFTAAKN